MLFQGWADLWRILLVAVLAYPMLVVPAALRAQRVTEGEIRQSVRSQGIGDLALVAAVVLETDGSFSVIASAQAGDLTALPVSGTRGSGA